MFSFLDRNALWIGAVVGLVLPFVGYAVLLMIYEQLESFGWLKSAGFSTDFRQRTIAIVAICLNLWPLNVYQKKRYTDTMRGIVFPTALYVIVWVVYFFGHIFGG
ncbi:MAG: hypothetical protein HUU01_06535 [Saprospiraceae bacterium]|nr:hypothetical protein [Saprospiraceae bacterium]